MDAKQKASELFSECNNFACKGNVIDPAVGVIVGAAFGKIANALVKRLIMPVVSLLLPGAQGYLGWKLALGAKEVPYGLLIGKVVKLLIVALALYRFIVKLLAAAMKAWNEEAAAPAPPPKQEQLLTEMHNRPGEPDRRFAATHAWRALAAEYGWCRPAATRRVARVLGLPILTATVFSTTLSAGRSAMLV